MKIGIIQISDIHYEISKRDTLEKAFNLLKLSINMLYSNYILNMDKCLILINGDIVNAGNNEEDYDDFYEKFKAFHDNLKTEYKNKIISFVTAGNHDCDCTELNFNNFFKFQDRILKLNEFENIKKISDNYYIISIGNIDLFALNSSSIFPALQLNDTFTKFINKGDVKFEIETIKQELEKSANRFRIMIMHHPLDYCEDNNQEEINEICKNYFNIVLCAHKHYGESKTKITDKSKHYSIIQSGALINTEKTIATLDNTSYNVLLVETHDNLIRIQYDVFNYNSKTSIYTKSNDDSGEFEDSLKVYTKMPLSIEFESQFEHSPYFGNEHKLFDYFTFQSLISYDNNENRNKISSLSELDKFILENKRIYIEGQCHSGKTTLAKKIFEYYRIEKRMFPLYISLKDYVIKDIKNCINLAIGGIYKKGNSEYFQLADIRSRILIFDDITFDNYEKFNEILEENNINFEYIIVFYDNSLTINHGNKFLFESQNCYKIVGFYGEERNNLINNIIKYDSSSNNEKELIINRIKKIIKNNSHYILRDPLFLVIFIKYIIKNYKRHTNEVKFDEIYTEIMKEHISNIIAFENNGKIDDSKAIAILPIVANEMYILNKNWISYSKCLELIDKYHDLTFGSRIVKATDILGLLVKSTLLIPKGDNLYFNNDRFFAFFLAQYLLMHDEFIEIKKLFDKPVGVIMDVLENIILIDKGSKNTNKIIGEMINSNLYIGNENEKIRLEKQKDSNVYIPIPKYDSFNDARTISKEKNKIIDNEFDERLVTYSNNLIVQKEIIPQTCIPLLKNNNMFLLLSRYIGSSKMLTNTEDKKKIVFNLYNQIQILSDILFNKIINSDEFKRYIDDNKISSDLVEVVKCLIYYTFIECAVSNAYNYDLKNILLDYDFNTIETKLIKLSIAILSDDSELVTKLSLHLFKQSNNKGVKLIVSALIWRYIGETITLSEKNFIQLNNELFNGSLNKNKFLNQKCKNFTI